MKTQEFSMQNPLFHLFRPEVEGIALPGSIL
jgi:hypothetical protein